MGEKLLPELRMRGRGTDGTQEGTQERLFWIRIIKKKQKNEKKQKKIKNKKEMLFGMIPGGVHLLSLPACYSLRTKKV